MSLVELKREKTTLLVQAFTIIYQYVFEDNVSRENIWWNAGGSWDGPW